MAHITDKPYIDSGNIPVFLNALSLKLRNLYGDVEINLLVVGGSALAIKYNLRGTVDIDAYTAFGRNIKGSIEDVAKEYNIFTDWLNYDFAYTESFSRRLESDAIFYRNFNKILNVYVVSDISQLCMKATAWRRKDVEDVKFLVATLKNNGCTFEDFLNQFQWLYGDSVKLRYEPSRKIQKLFK